MDVNEELNFFWGGGVVSQGSGLGGQGGCDRRIDELKFFGNFTKKKFQVGGGGGGSVWGGQGGCE